MRGILFRGKDDESGNFVYGTVSLERDCRNRKMLCNIKPCIVWVETGLLYSCFIIPETIGQFIGLTDKNGTKIFEGDIVRYICNGENAEPDIGIIKFSECQKNLDNYYNCGFYIDWAEKSVYLRTDIGYWTNYKENKIEVIGNIHDNPELLNT